MPQYTADNILVRPRDDGSGLLLSITPEDAGWEYISFQARRLPTGGTWPFATGEHELVVVNLTGTYDVTSSRGAWTGVGGRENVFTGAADALYLPQIGRAHV